MNITIMVNGVAATPGCYVDGQWGQYGPDRLARYAEEFGWKPDRPSDDPRIIRDFAERAVSSMQDALFAWVTAAADDIERWLNENTAPVCPHCHGPVYATSDGFYRHVAFPSEAARLNDGEPCEFSAIDSPWFPCWEWCDGEFFLNIYDGDGNQLEPDQLEALSKQ